MQSDDFQAYPRHHNFSFKIDDNIIYFTFYVENITLEIARDAIQHRMYYQEGNTMPILVDCANVSFVEAEARRYFAGTGSEGLTACALLVHKPAQEIQSRIFAHYYRPVVPVQFFYDQEEAVAWLEAFKSP